MRNFSADTKIKSLLYASNESYHYLMSGIGIYIKGRDVNAI